MPNIPPMLYIGYDKNRQLQLFPTPPDNPSQDCFPYSTRSFVHQAAQELGGCSYDCSPRGETLGEPVFTDMCGNRGDENEGGYQLRDRKCHILSGWSRAQTTCELWNLISTLCQTDYEKRFLHQYMGLVKGRNFPMLIPQARIGIAERRRPDFVLYAPIQYFKYRWYAIELDGAHVGSDDDRNLELTSQGYEVLSFRPGAGGYYAEVQSLLEKVQMDMTEAERDRDAVAIVREVRSSEPSLRF
jgi:hypothetical protein